jgi:microcystin-dependent protein
LLPITQNSALFSLLGTLYGGNGTSNFALPNLQGSIPIHQGNGPGLSPYAQGETGGSATVTLLSSEMPAHIHTVPVTSVNGRVNSPTTANVLGDVGGGRGGGGGSAYGTTTLANMATQSSNAVGGNQPHNNMAPYVAMNYCIALTGIFPSRN